MSNEGIVRDARMLCKEESRRDAVSRGGTGVSPVIHAQDPRASFKLPAGVYLARYSRRDLTETSGRFTFTDSA